MTALEKDKWVCKDTLCGWCGLKSALLRAPDPFKRGGKLKACPKCFQQELAPACDELNCWCMAAHGLKTGIGYRLVCSAHYLKIMTEMLPKIGAGIKRVFPG